MNGRFAAFASSATNLVPGDTNGVDDVFIRDRQSGTTQRVSVRTGGGQGDGFSFSPAISSEGRFVAFASSATDLVPGDTNNQVDIFVRDRWRGITQRVSVRTGGGQSNGSSVDPALSMNGRFVAFASSATNLVPGDTNGVDDVFIRDRQSGTTQRVSVGRNGAQGNGDSGVAAMSAEGQFVVFGSNASNLVPGDTNDMTDVFIRDRQSGTTRRVSVRTDGGQGNDSSSAPALSANGRFVAFDSSASNLVPGDTNGQQDVFVRDRRTGTTQRVSVKTGGNQGNNISFGTPALSANGRFVAFNSEASNLVPGDTNFAIDVFVRDRWEGTTRRVSVRTGGDQGNRDSSSARVSADGRFVAFRSRANNLVPGDTNGQQDVFIHTR
jgi:Tol biopolymer transport system component